MLDSPYIIISHNHPSGDVNPSQSDIDATIELDKALQTVDIGLLDHVIVSKNNIHSLKEYCEF